MGKIRRFDKHLADRLARARECPHPEKVAYDDKRAAKKAARLTRLNTYKCQCGAWHLTSGGRRYVL